MSGKVFLFALVTCSFFVLQADAVSCNKTGIGKKRYGGVKRSENSLLSVSRYEHGMSKFVEGMDFTRLDYEEAHLLSQGFRPQDIKGLDYMKYQLAFHKAMREAEKEGDFDRRETHVPEYAAQVLFRLEWMKEGMDEQMEYAVKEWRENIRGVNKAISKLKDFFKGEKMDKQSDVYYESLNQMESTIRKYNKRIKNKDKTQVERLKAYEDLKKEAWEKVAGRQVTYDWFMKWNFRLTAWASLTSDLFYINDGKYWKKHYNSLNSLAAEMEKDNVRDQEFDLLYAQYSIVEMPGYMMFSTHEDLGYFALNEGAVDKITPQMMINKPRMVDGEMNNPVEALVHDILHYRAKYGFGSVTLHNYIQKQRRLLLKEDLEKLEFIYYIYNHESVGIKSMEDMKENTKIRLLDPDDLGSYLPESVDINSESRVEAYVSSAAEIFERAVQGFPIF